VNQIRNECDGIMSVEVTVKESEGSYLLYTVHMERRGFVSVFDSLFLFVFLCGLAATLQFCGDTMTVSDCVDVYLLTV